MPDPARHAGRHAAVHGPRAGPRRAARPPGRPVQPRQRPLRHVHRAARRSAATRRSAVIRRVCERRPRPIRELNPDDPVLARRDHRAAPRQGPRRAVPVGRRGGRPARPAPRCSCRTPRYPRSSTPGRRGRRGRPDCSPRREGGAAAARADGARPLRPGRVVHDAAPAPGPPGRELAEVYHQDFRSAHLDERAFRIVGRDDDPSHDARPEPRGLLLTVPAGRWERRRCLATKFGVRGDFEITAAFEVLPTAPPRTGYGAGPELLIKPLGGWDTYASMARLRRGGGTSRFARSTAARSAARAAWPGEWPAAVGGSGRFRLARDGRDAPLPGRRRPVRGTSARSSGPSSGRRTSSQRAVQGDGRRRARARRGDLERPRRSAPRRCPGRTASQRYRTRVAR